MSDINPHDKPVVLIVDDTADNIRILVEALGDDYEIMVATRGAQAISVARAKPQPDLILLDMMMPGMDGHEVCRELKSDNDTRNIPIIFVTADSSPLTEEKSLLLGAVDYVTKPFSLPVVRARVRTHILLKYRTDRLELLAKQDGLTGIANRRRFDELMEMEWQRCARHMAPLSVLIADVDHFKLFNDTYGHGAGDKCLQNIAKLLSEAASRPGDLAARYGGEEFAILLPFTPYNGASLVAERLRDTVAKRCSTGKAESSCRKVTVSVGFATIIPSEQSSPTTLLKVADEMLYQAKAEGRNRVVGKDIQ